MLLHLLLLGRRVLLEVLELFLNGLILASAVMRFQVVHSDAVPLIKLIL